MKTVLIPTDFSKDSQYTIRFVLNLLQEVQTSWRILLVNTFMVLNTDAKQIITKNDELKMQSKEGLIKALAETKKQVTNPHITVETMSSMGSLNNVIYQIIHQEKIEFVAMGKDGGRHVEAVSALLKKEHCPLLVTFIE